MDYQHEVEHLRRNLAAAAKDRDGAYERGMNAAITKQRERESLSARAFASKITSLLQPGNVIVDEARSTRGTWPRFLQAGQRAANHLISDIDPASGAAPHGVVSMGATNAPAITEALMAAWGNDAMPSASYATLVEQVGPGVPNLPILSTAPTAGPQGGEKTEGYSAHFDVTNNDAAVTIDSTLYLNISGVVEAFGGQPIAEAIMRAAVAAEANAQIAQAIADNASVAADIGEAFASFDNGRFVPSAVVVPPSQVFGVKANELVAAGIRVVIDPGATAIMVVATGAVIGWFKSMEAIATEPSVFGKQVGYAVFGKVGVDPAGVAMVTPTP